MGVELFTHSLCPYAQRAEIALREKGVMHRVVSIDLSNKPKWYRSIHPRMLVPALRCEGRVVVESLDICRFVEDHFHGPELMPREESMLTKANMLLHSCDGLVSSGLRVIMGRDGRFWGIGTHFNQQDVHTFETEADLLLNQLRDSRGPFLFGSQVTLVDIAYMPFIERFALAMENFVGYNLRDLGEGRMGQWMDGDLYDCLITLGAGMDPSLWSIRRNYITENVVD